MTLPRISSTGVPWLDSSSPLADATKPNVFLGEWYDWDKEKLKPSCALCINNGCVVTARTYFRRLLLPHGLKLRLAAKEDWQAEKHSYKIEGADYEYYLQQ